MYHLRIPLAYGLALTGAVLFAGPLRAEEPAPAAAPKPASAGALASDAEAAAAIATFKEAWKAKGLKGDERLMQRDFALSELAKVQHPLVVAEMGDVAKSGDADLKILAIIYLAEQRATPALAGQHVLAALQKNVKDPVIVLTGLQSLGTLKYLGGGQVLKDLLKNDDFAVKKYAISTVGKVGDMRLLDELLKLLGVDPKAPAPAGPQEEKSGGKEVVEEGYSWEGAEATVDHGDADNTKENAEAKAKAEAQMAANKAAAKAAAGGGGGGGGGGPSAPGGDGGGGGRGGSARSKDELKPYILKALKSLTGETFMNSRELRTWLGANGPKIEEAKKACEKAEAEQKAAAK